MLDPVHNLPLLYFKESIVTAICSKVGAVKEIHLEDEEGIPYDDIVRVRVILNIKEYLIPAIWLTDEERWIYIKYEKVNALCRFCGMVDHGEDDCAHPYPLSEVLEDFSEWTRLKIPSLQEGEDHYPFGEWMLCGKFEREYVKEWGYIRDNEQRKEEDTIESQNSGTNESTQHGG